MAPTGMCKRCNEVDYLSSLSPATPNTISHVLHSFVHVVYLISGRIERDKQTFNQLGPLPGRNPSGTSRPKHPSTMKDGLCRRWEANIRTEEVEEIGNKPGPS
jgi:hypothetical protein